MLTDTPVVIAYASAVQMILAADVIYDDDATSHFVDFVLRLLVLCHERQHQKRPPAQGQDCTSMAHRAQELQSDAACKHPPRKQRSAGRGMVKTGMDPTPHVMVALEKRVNFTLRDLAPCAPAYDFFQQCIAERSVRGVAVWEVVTHECDSTLGCGWRRRQVAAAQR